MLYKVVLSKKVLRQLSKIPRHITENLASWIEDVENSSLQEVRKRPGYHDEPLKGTRKGQRSIRLSRAYRAIYIADENSKDIKLIRIIEVNKHEY